MHKIIPILLLSGALLGTAAVPSIREVHTASNSVLVVTFKSTVRSLDAVNVDTAGWTINGTEPLDRYRYVVPANRAYHYIYMTTAPLEEGKEYAISTPYGDTTITFSERTILCESIKTNQAAYSALATNNFANFSIWLGTGGGKDIEGEVPAYEVFEQYTGNVVAGGTLAKIGENESSGDVVYSIDLSAVPEGGPYKIAVKGYGCSYPFGIGGLFSKRLAYIMFRGQYYQRCGCPIVSPYGMDIREKPCHTLIYKVDGPIRETAINVNGSEETFACYGGYHDAGDADRRAYHMANPVINLMFCETFPDLFTDGQFNIPDKFDEEYNILGKGNGIPDIIDEAAWGTLVWEYLQNNDGSIQFGTETNGYPSPFEAPMDKDDLLYGTVQTDDRPAAIGAGLFMHLARAVKPYDETRAEELAARAEKSYGYIQRRISDPENLYYNIQKYLYNGDEEAHAKVKELKNAVDGYENNLFECHGYMINDDKFDNPGYIMSYILEQERETDPDVVAYFIAALKKAADANLAELDKYAYPVANDPVGTRWGHNVMQPQYAGAPLLYWKLTGEQRYFDGATAMLNYALGQNPLGRSYVTGFGFHQIENPHDREYAYAERLGFGPKPGITVFGPGIHMVFTTDAEFNILPEKDDLPIERLFGDNREAISMTEFTIFQTMHYYAVYTVLAGGGTWDGTTDPFAEQQVAVDTETKNVIGTTRQLSGWISGVTCTLEFTLSVPCRVDGMLYLIDGKRVAAFTSSKLGAGRQILSVPVNSFSAPVSGGSILLCRLRGEDGTEKVARILKIR